MITAETAAREALEKSGLPVLLSGQASEENVSASLDWLATHLVTFVRPVVQAEVLADLADEFAQDFPSLALAMDEASHQIRETITR